MTNVTVNGLTAVHAGSNGILTTTDVCLTPPFCPPIPYTNIAKSTDAAMTATSVTINGNPACTFTSNFAVSQGDSPGGCGGIISGSVNGMAEFITFSNNVFIEGIPVVRQTDKMVSNFKNTSPMPLQQPGAAKAPDVADEGPNELDEADLPYEVDIHVVGDELKSLKSIIGVVDLDLAPEEEEGEAATLEKSNLKSSSAQNSSSDTNSNIVPLKRKLLVKAVSGPTTLNVGDTATYKVTKTSLPDATSAELQHVNWQLKSEDGKILKEFKKHGAKLELKIDDKLQGETFYVMPYINSPIKSISVKATLVNKRKVHTLVVHHSASASATTTRADIDKWHKKRGFSQIGYHKVIEAKGNIVNGRPEEIMGAQAKGANKGSLGVCVAGNFEKEKPSAEQITALVTVLTSWCKTHKLNSSSIYGHYNVPNGKTATDCPGKNLKSQLDTIKKRVDSNLSK